MTHRVPTLIRAGLLLLLVLPFVLPLLRPGWIQSHEGLSYPVRLAQVERCWADGYLSARWFPDLNQGQGYPFLCFYAPLLFYVAGLFQAAGASLALSLKLPVVLAAVLGAGGAYRLTRLGTGPAGAFVAAALYTYAPYHVRDVFIRGDLAEYLAAGFLPWSLWAVLRLCSARSARDVALVSVAGALPILSHNIMGLFTGVMMALTAVVAVLASKDRFRTGRTAALGGLGALGLTAFFWVSALYEKRFVQIDAMTEGVLAVEHNFVEIRELFGAGAAPGVGQGLPLSFEIGYPALLLLGAAAWALRRPARSARPVLAVGALMLVTGLVMSTALAAPLYRSIDLLRFVQFPWRFFVLLSLGAAVLGGLGFGALLDRRGAPLRIVGAAAVVVLTVLGVARILGPKPNFPLPTWAVDPVELSKSRTTTSSSGEYLPRWVTQRRNPVGFEHGVRVLGDARIEGPGRRVGRYDFTVTAGEPVTVLLQDVYYPGWEATIDGAPLPTAPHPGPGNVELAVPPGRHQLRVRLEPTAVRRGAQWASLVTATLGAAGLAASAARRRRGGASCPTS